jgi:hypothetical protein
MKKIKLPRKRKKRLIKAIGSTNYMGAQIVNEILSEEGRKDAHKFPIFKVERNRVIILGYW